MNLRSTAVLGAVFVSAAAASLFVASQLPREGEVAHLPPAPTPAAPAETSPPLERAMTAEDGFAEVRATAGNEPLPEAAVALYLAVPPAPGEDAPGWRRAGEVRAGADGVARLPAGPGYYLAAVRAPGLAPGHAVVVRAPGEQATRVEVALAPPGVLEGSVLPRGGQAVAARVQAIPLAPREPGGALPLAPPEETAVASTDAAGAFRLAGLAPGLWALRIEAAGFRPVFLPRVAVPRAGPLLVDVEPATAAPAAPGGAAALAVTVTGPDRRPAAGARVTVLAHEARDVVARAVTGADGVVRLEGLPPAPVDVLADLLGATPARAAGLSLRAGETFPLPLALAPPGAVEGTVTDGAGQPLAGARVRIVARGDGSAGRLPLEVRSGFDGAFRVAGVEAGRAEVVALETGADLGVSRPVSVPAGGTATVTLALPATGVLAGRAAGEGGRSAPLGTAVVATPLRGGPGTRSAARTLADASGNYQLSLPAGEYRVHAAPAEAEATDLRVAPGFARVEPGRTARLDVVAAHARRAGGLEVAVVEPGGAPSPGAVVALSRADDARIALAEAAGEDGRLRLASELGLAGRPVTIRAHAGGRSGAWTGVLPAAGAVTVALAPGGVLRGAVRAAGGPKVAGFTLEVSSQPSPQGWRTLDVHRFAGDRFELSDLPAEPLRLVVRTDDGRRGTAEVVLAPSEIRTVEVPVAPARAGR